jgi:lipopolysaccharide assembly outer membrane protein LptD (OstA)
MPVCARAQSDSTASRSPVSLEAPAPDTTHADSASPARAGKDSTRADSLTAKKDTTSGIDTLVAYSATDSVVYSIATKKMKMYSKGDVKYRTMELTADRIDVDWNSSLMHANGIFDTADTTSRRLRKLRGIVDTSDTTAMKLKGPPIMKDGGEEYHGRELTYNFRTKRGLIDIANTSMDQGYYHGEEIKKVSPGVLFVENGRYTTCDKDDPDYYFASPKMKVMPGDKIVGEPVYLYISDVPVFALPFAVFPSNAGRRSGIITPSYGEDNNGKFLRNLGYFWAISDYMDADFRSDVYTEGGYDLYTDFNYGLRYYFNGSLTGEYRDIHTGEDIDPDKQRSTAYDINLTHNQTIDPTSTLAANFTFASNNAYQNTLSLNQALQQSIASNATYSKTFEGTENSLSLSISRQQNLRDGTSDNTLPSFSFSHGQSYPFRSDDDEDDPSKLPWYKNIGMSYGVSASNERQTVLQTFTNFKPSANAVPDTNTAFETERTQSVNSNFALTMSPKAGYITITPAISYADSRTFTSNDLPYLSDDSLRIMMANERASQLAGTVTTGVTGSTRLYGILQPNLFGIDAIRHTLSPSLGFNYVNQVTGNNLAPKQMNMSMGLGNVFEMKMKQGDTAKEADKFELLNLSLGSNYDFMADSFKLSDIGVTGRTTILGSAFSLDGGMTFDPYTWVKTDSGTYVRLNKISASHHGPLARLVADNLSLSTTLSGTKSSRPVTGGADTTHHNPSGTKGIYNNDEPDFSIPWNLQLGFTYSESKDPNTPSRSVNMNANLGFNLTENWKFSAAGSYDLLARQVSAPQVNISRDLHCWIMDFSWVPIGAYRNFQFSIHVKAPQLQDLKLTKSGSDNELR